MHRLQSERSVKVGVNGLNRIMVIGISAGVGKSTFARRLGKATNINVYHLDALYWKPGWIEATLGEFSKEQKEILNLHQWIIEGNYSNTFETRAESADTLIYLELPLYLNQEDELISATLPLL